MKLFTTKQIAQLDRFTIENEPISDIDLMERASLRITQWIQNRYSSSTRIILFAGPGNNGGDALAVSRQLASLGFDCSVYLLSDENRLQGSPAINWQRLKEQQKVKMKLITGVESFPLLDGDELIVEGLFGSGLTRPLNGLPALIVSKINSLPNTVISIDIPAGLFGEDNSENNPETILKADYTLTFQFPKISFLFPENEIFTGKWEVLPINLHPEGIASLSTDFYFTEYEDIKKYIIPRKKFSHKGIFGHALLLAGGFGKMGAAALASKSCLRAGAGLLTTHVPKIGYQVLQTAIPEAMISVDLDEQFISQLPDLNAYSAIGAGPGIGTSEKSAGVIHQLLVKTNVPLVLDADALNILSENKQWLDILPKGSILTPHPGEFRRLAGHSGNSFQRLMMQQEFAKKYHAVVVLKGAYTTIATPDGKIYFNSTGNPGMATAGSGDVLTGILTGLLAQGFTPENAAVTGVFLHGLAGDLAAKRVSENSLIASDIIESTGEAFKKFS